MEEDSYFFGGVRNILENDNLSIANLEGVLSDTAKILNPKKYNYKGYSKYANILKKGNVEMVNLANNHTFDYLDKGYNDTISALNKYKVLYFGYHNYQIVEINGIKIGIYGLNGWDYSSTKNEIINAINYLNSNDVQFIIANFHWGDMRMYKHNKTQESIAHYAIDNGTDIVIGHHPHVLQGIEKYKDKYIAYSLGNFVYGGIYYPYDSDSVILQMHIKDDSYDIELIPVSITSSGYINDYRPMLLDGNDKERVLKKILKNSVNFTYNY